MEVRKGSIALTAFALLASFGSFAAETYKVTARLSHAGKSFGEPVAVVSADTPATLEVAGPDAYKLKFTVTDVANHEIKVSAELDSSHGSIAPVVVVKPGEPAIVSVGDLSLTLTVDRTGS